MSHSRVSDARDALRLSLCARRARGRARLPPAARGGDWSAGGALEAARDPPAAIQRPL